MIRDTEKKDWATLRKKIKSKFEKLSDHEIDGLHGHMELLTSKVQKAYSYDQRKAEQECKAFSESLKK